MIGSVSSHPVLGKEVRVLDRVIYKHHNQHRRTIAFQNLKRSLKAVHRLRDEWSVWCLERRLDADGVGRRQGGDGLDGEVDVEHWLRRVALDGQAWLDRAVLCAGWLEKMVAAAEFVSFAVVALAAFSRIFAIVTKVVELAQSGLRDMEDVEDVGVLLESCDPGQVNSALVASSSRKRPTESMDVTPAPWNGLDTNRNKTRRLEYRTVEEEMDAIFDRLN